MMEYYLESGAHLTPAQISLVGSSELSVVMERGPLSDRLTTS